MKYIESEVLELKTKFSDTICKDIVAFFEYEWWRLDYRYR